MIIRLISIGEAAKILGVSVVTMRRCDKSGELSPVIRTYGNHRRYKLTDILSVSGATVVEDGFTVCYARVSSHDQKKDLVVQSDRLEAHCAAEDYSNILPITDLGSGLNYKKKGLKRLLSLLLAGKVSRIVMTYKYRLLRFGSELIFSICDYMGVLVEVLSAPVAQTKEQILCADVIELMTVFSARLYGSRSHKNLKAA
jgi:putative resolvase